MGEEKPFLPAFALDLDEEVIQVNVSEL